MRHVNLLLLASLLMPSASALAQEYKKVWADEFDNVGAVEENNWNFEVGNSNNGFGNWELENYQKANAVVDYAPDGTTKALVITAKPDMTSARLYTKDKVSFKYGKLEARIMIPKTANGLWPAFWMLGQKGTWPSCGEIDILEMGHADGIKQGTQEKLYSGACHWGFYANGGYPNYAKFTTSPSSLQDGKFHKFTLEWTPQVINMFLDDNATPYYSMDISDRSAVTSPGNYFNKEFYMLVNLAIGGTFTGITNRSNITALQSGEQKMYVDYIRLYQKEGEEYYTINGREVHNLKEEGGLEDTTTELGSYGSKSLDASGQSTFDFANSHDYVLVAVSDGVKDAMGDKVKADYRPGVSTNQMDIWEGTFSANTSAGVNSFGFPERYTDLSVGSAGWSGLGFESPAGLDYSMLDDSYFIHFAMKNDDVAAHNTYSIWVGGAKFALGNGGFMDGGNTYPKLGDFKRDGEWYSFDIPVKVLKKLNPSAFDGCNAACFNIFSLLGGGITGTRVMLDNVFFYKNETKNPDDTPEADNTQLGDYGYKALDASGKSVFDFSKGKDYVIISASTGVMQQMGDKIKADYSVDNTTQHLYIWDDTYMSSNGSGVNSFGLDETYSVYTVRGALTWSGLGFAGVKDLSMLDDTYCLHFSVKSSDALVHASREFGAGAARFTLGNASMENTRILGDYPRNGQWYSFDIPVSVLKEIANPLFPDADGGANAFRENAFCALAGGAKDTQMIFDNVFFYKKDSSTGIAGNLMEDGQDAQVLGIYDLSGRKVERMNGKGIYVVKTKQGAKKVIKQ